MPIYDYKCECGWSGEITTTVGERHNMACPRSGHKLTLVITGGARFRFAGVPTKGGGPDKFTADVLGIPLHDLPAGLRTTDDGGKR